MTCWQAMKRLEDIGYSFHLKEGRAVGVLAGDAPPEASALLDIARSDREAAADYVRQREAGAVVVDDGCTYSVWDALAIAQAVRRGDAVLIAPVIFHREPMRATVLWKPVHGMASTVLEWHRERLEKRLQEMEQQPIDGMTEAETDRLCDQYVHYKMILEVCR